MFKSSIAAVFGALLAASSAQAASPFFDVTFGGVATTATLPLTVTNGGESATFSGPAGTFSVYSTVGLFQEFSTGIGDTGSYGGDTLTVTFSTPTVLPIMISFGLEDAFGTFAPDTLTITPNVGPVVNAATTLDTLPLSEPEGTAIITQTGITSLTLTSADAFTIGSIANVPEPFTISLLATGLIGLAAARRRSV